MRGNPERNPMSICNICPRACKIERKRSASDRGTVGYCASGMLPVISRAALHHWEEPCIAGTRGAGTVFFAGCNLSCVYCQNYEISEMRKGIEVSVDRLKEIYQELIRQGAHNIDLVTPTHYTHAIFQSLRDPLPVPVVYNCGGYESVHTVAFLRNKVQCCLPHLKYMDSKASKRYSDAPDYFEKASATIEQMFRQTGPYEIGPDGILKKGVLIRHLILPGQVEDTKRIMEYIAETFAPGDVLFSLMRQYIPYGRASEFPEINRRITDEEYEEVEEQVPFPFESKQVTEPAVIEEPAYTNEEEEVENTDEPDFSISEETNEEDEAYKGPVLPPYNPRLDLENYKFPSLDLLNEYEDDGPNIDMEEQNANKDRIIKVLRSFGIEISSIKASVGPTITLYEITPAEGVRISKIRNLEDDIALSLSALGIRIIAPIPGKGTIGIEVPNANPRIVPMKSILNSKKFQETTYELPVALGKTITNEVFMVDLAKAPHMLVAGATGQGKSVGLNAIVTSLLYKKHPAELKFVIVDPKKVEFAIYAPIEKHFLAKLPDGEDAIITDVTKVVQTLNSLCIEMDSRYDLLRKAGCRNIKEYNAKFINRQLNPEKGHRFMPYIVIIIDEFGDLIMTAGKEVELPICRIAQLARAVGIHAIIATQRPTTNIITGTIKANFPARVAFRVAAMMDSRTILDRSGAQQLIGKGDMLYLQGNDPVRVQCAFVDTPEVEKIANYISKQQGYTTAFMLPEYVGEESESSVGEVDMNRLDPMFEDAARLVVIHQQGSTSLIQRKFSIGYNRAGRIMDQLEKAGIVGPTQGSKARDVLCMDETDLEMKLNNLQQ